MLSAVLKYVKFPFSLTANPLRIQMQTIKPELPSTPILIADLLRTTQAKIRRQMLNPSRNTIDKEQAQLLSLINGFRLQAEGYSAEMRDRPPVVTIMGHVDHGKTTLLDFLRCSDITKHEYGGITQKIGAFNVEYKNEKVTVIDTPGHQAFVNMRMRGATVTDMIILVVSAAEGVKRQTLEVIEIARKAHIPLIIAINKIDLPEADPEGVEEELTKNGVAIEPAGGTVPVVHISAKNGMNVDLLIELVLEQWKEMGVKADYGAQLEAAIIEAHQCENQQSSATMLIQKGTLKVGDWLVVGTHYCKVKYIKDDRSSKLPSAYPGQAVEVVGFKQLPSSGQLVFRVDSQAKAKFITDRRLKKAQQDQQKDILSPTSTKIKITSGRQKRALYSGFGTLWLDKFKEVEEKLKEENEQIEKLVKKNLATPEQLKKLEDNKLELEGLKEYTYQYLGDVVKKENTLNLIIKTGDRGCEETVLKEFNKIKKELQEKLKLDINLLRTQVGQVHQTNIRDAHTFQAEIFCFATTAKPCALKAMKQLNLRIHQHKLLHTFLQDIRQTIINKSKGSTATQKDKGSATIAEVFKIAISKKQMRLAAGIRINEGRLCKKYKFRLFRNGEPVSEVLKIQSMKHFKKEVIEMKKGEECTVIFQGEVVFEKGDTLKAYE